MGNWGYSKWWQIKQSPPGLNRGLSSNFWWLRSAHHEKFTEECVMHTEKHVLVKRMFTNEQNMGLPQLTWVEKTVHWMETHRPSNKEKVWIMLIVFWNMKGPIIIDFLEKASIVNRVYYYHILRQNLPYLLNDLHTHILGWVWSFTIFWYTIFLVGQV